MKCAIYARYSSHEQDGSSTIESQLRECKDYILKQGWEIDHRYIFVDRAISGSSTDGRHAFQSVIACAQKHPSPFQRIVVWKFSRFARDRESSAIYKGLLRRCGVEIISVSEPVDRNSASGILTEGMYEVIDQFYSARLGEEVHDVNVKDFSHYFGKDISHCSGKYISYPFGKQISHFSRS